jgi:AcrR family transcriptional regulator
VSTPRDYDSSRRRDQAELTRADIAAAARRLFADQGWSATTVRDIARAANVSEPTVYKAYGGKAGLAVALVDALEREADGRGAGQDSAAAAGQPARQLSIAIAFDRRVFEAGADVIQTLREAGRVVRELGDAYREGRRRGREHQLGLFASWPVGTLQEGLDPDTAADLYAGLINVDTWQSLAGERGWSAERIEQWWQLTVPQLLLA